MLLELGIGDAYGAGFEYASSDLVQCYNDLSSSDRTLRKWSLRQGLHHRIR
jgi:hypothetical protein